tara:strand:- start:2327 stop:2554 length:228 start_codon:yes stop_codon:yes gene_type:complete
MRIFILIWIYLLLNNCSFNNESQYWTEDSKKKIINDIKLDEILDKSNDIRQMTVKEYKIYIDDLTKKSKYPNIDK